MQKPDRTHTRKETMLMATGDTGSVSWQKLKDPKDVDPALVIAGGIINGTPELATIARELLFSARPTTVHLNAIWSYNYPQHTATHVEEDDETTMAVVFDTEPSPQDITAALIYAAGYGSSTVLLNDNAQAMAETMSETMADDDEPEEETHPDTITTDLY